MILKNSKGAEKNFTLLFEIQKENIKYVVYKDPLTENIYGGVLEAEKLKKLSDDEFEYISNMIEKLKG